MNNDNDNDYDMNSDNDYALSTTLQLSFSNENKIWADNEMAGYYYGKTNDFTPLVPNGFLDASSYLYMRLCPPVGWMFRPSDRLLNALNQRFSL